MKRAMKIVWAGLAVVFLAAGTAEAGYRDGMNLYQYVSSDPATGVDPTGLWGPDVHETLTAELATRAGIACPKELGKMADRPDHDESNPMTAFAKRAALLSGAAVPRVPGSIKAEFRKEARRLAALAAKWHFPTDADGVVRKNSVAANAIVKDGLAQCDFELFAKGLHVLQDSWSHQGRPLFEGAGHGRGVKLVQERELSHGFAGKHIRGPRGISIPVGVPYPTYKVKASHWEAISGVEAAVSSSADDVKLWPEDAVETGVATYQKLLDFKAKCACACPGKNGTKVLTATRVPAQTPAQVETWLKNTKFPGKNKVAWTSP